MLDSWKGRKWKWWEFDNCQSVSLRTVIWWLGLLAGRAVAAVGGFYSVSEYRLFANCFNIQACFELLFCLGPCLCCKNKHKWKPENAYQPSVVLQTCYGKARCLSISKARPVIARDLRMANNVISQGSPLLFLQFDRVTVRVFPTSGLDRTVAEWIAEGTMKTPREMTSEIGSN